MKIKEAILKALQEGNMDTLIMFTDIGVDITVVGEQVLQEAYNKLEEQGYFKQIESIEAITKVKPIYTRETINNAVDNYFKHEKQIINNLITELSPVDYKLHLL